jgi:hypothetical protein
MGAGFGEHEPMAMQRRPHRGGFKATVVLEAFRRELMLAGLVRGGAGEDNQLSNRGDYAKAY